LHSGSSSDQRLYVEGPRRIAERDPFDPRILDLRGVIFGVTLILKEAKKGRLGSEWGRPLTIVPSICL